jgi:radical SAM protein with 4Fe4S-binding SPASM domain
MSITNIKKEDYEAVAGQDWPIYDDFVAGNTAGHSQLIIEEIKKFVKKTQDIYNEGYNYLSKEPFYIKKEDLTEQQYTRLVKSKTFCMLPWVHMHAFPDGRAYPCCLSDNRYPVGDLRKNTMEQIWNQKPYRTLRINMLNDQTSKECNKCYEQETNGFFSMRNDANRNYGYHVSEVDHTDINGHHPEFRIRYWDVRFSNLCNFKCRSCGPIFSSNWFNDHVKLYLQKPDVLGREMARVEYTTGNEDGMLEQMLPHIPYLEQVYFAGGEPLIMKEHYFMLEKLIEYGKTDIRIQYNTNFSELAFKDKHVFEYWKHFQNVSVAASLDASGDRAELMRKGTNWAQISLNRKHMIEQIPHVDFYVSSTLSVMNILHILDFHKEWVELGLIDAKDFNINICQGPDWYRIDILPEDLKRNIVVPAYEEHIAWLAPQDKLQRATNGFKAALKFIQANDRSDLLPKFREEVKKLDNVRNENFWDTFSELLILK